MAQPKHVAGDAHTTNANPIQVKSLNAHEVFERVKQCVNMEKEIKLYIDQDADLSNPEYARIVSLRKEKGEREAEILANIERFTDLESRLGKVSAELLEAYNRCWKWDNIIKAVKQHDPHAVGSIPQEHPAMITGFKDGVPHEMQVVSGTAQDIHSSVEIPHPTFHYPVAPDRDRFEFLYLLYNRLKYWLDHQASHKSGEVRGAASGNKL